MFQPLLPMFDFLYCNVSIYKSRKGISSARKWSKLVLNASCPIVYERKKAPFQDEIMYFEFIYRLGNSLVC